MSLTSAAVILALSALAAAPEIAHITEPACNGEVIVITGEGLDPAATRVRVVYLGPIAQRYNPMKDRDDPAALVEKVGHQPPVPDIPPKEAMDCPVLGGGRGYLQVLMRYCRVPWVRIPATAALWVGNDDGWSRPYIVNRPQAQWLHPTTQTPGEVVRVFGRTFAWGYQLGAAAVFVRKAGGGRMVACRLAWPHREDGHTVRWCVGAWLPDDLEVGRYELFVHGRHGGAHGWSDPLELIVAEPGRRSGLVVNARNEGAAGDGLTDDTEALEKALGKSGGGTLFLPAGVYALSRTLEIPANVVVRGVSMHNTILCNLEDAAFTPREAIAVGNDFGKGVLVYGPTRFTIRDLTLRFMPATGSVLQVGRDQHWAEDVTLYRVRFEARQDYGLARSHPYNDSPVSLFQTRRLSMARCETYGPGGVRSLRKLEQCRFSQNTFRADRRWRGCMFKFWGAENCIFEDNTLTGDTRGLVMQTHFGVNYRNFIAGSTVERTTLGGNAGETYLVEGAGLLYESAVAGANGLALTTVDWPTVKGQPAAAETVVGRFAVVARGRGLGQWRRIAAADPGARRLTADRPWRVLPDASSTVVVMNGLIETVFVNNQEVDCAKGLYWYCAGAINSIVDRHVCDRSLGVTLMTLDKRQKADRATHHTAPDFFNLIRDCRVHDGGGIIVGAGGYLPEADGPHLPLASFANRVISNEVIRTKPGAARSTARRGATAAGSAT